MHAVLCPRCKKPVKLRKDGETLYEHKKPESSTRCPAGGLTWARARAGWTSLQWRTYTWLLKNNPEEADSYKTERRLT